MSENYPTTSDINDALRRAMNQVHEIGPILIGVVCSPATHQAIRRACGDRGMHVGAPRDFRDEAPAPFAGVEFALHPLMEFGQCEEYTDPDAFRERCREIEAMKAFLGRSPVEAAIEAVAQDEEVLAYLRKLLANDAVPTPLPIDASGSCPPAPSA